MKWTRLLSRLSDCLVMLCRSASARLRLATIIATSNLVPGPRLQLLRRVELRVRNELLANHIEAIRLNAASRRVIDTTAGTQDERLIDDGAWYLCENQISGRGKYVKIKSNFKWLVLGCIEAKFCK